MVFRPPLGQPFWKPLVDIPVEPPTGWHNETEQPSKTPRPIAATMRTAAVVAAAAFATGPWLPPSVPQIGSTITGGAGAPTALTSRLVYDPVTSHVFTPPPITPGIAFAGGDTLRSLDRVPYQPTAAPIPIPPPVAAPPNFVDQDPGRAGRVRPRTILNEPLVSAPAPVTWSD